MIKASELLDVYPEDGSWIISDNGNPYKTLLADKQYGHQIIAKWDSVEALEDRVKELEALLENIIHHQYNTSSLANLNGAIANARRTLKQTTKTK